MQTPNELQTLPLQHGWPRPPHAVQAWFAQTCDDEQPMQALPPPPHVAAAVPV
jgi:hypothetical protein